MADCEQPGQKPEQKPEVKPEVKPVAVQLPVDNNMKRGVLMFAVGSVVVRLLAIIVQRMYPHSY